jgi:hypothetical protein
VWTPTGLKELPIVGLLEPHGAAFSNGGAVVFMPLEAAQRAFGLPNQVNSVQVVLEDGTDAGRAEAVLAARLPSRAEGPEAVAEGVSRDEGPSQAD